MDRATTTNGTTTSTSTSTSNAGARTRGAGLVQEVLAELRREPRRLPSKLFYDHEGSRLFDAICEQPEYYLTRCELEILGRSGRSIARALGAGVILVELGSGSSRKTRLLLDALAEPVAYVPVDISGEHLEESVAALREAYPELTILPQVADFTAAMPEVPAGLPPAPVVTFFSGSSIGNFDRPQAIALMRRAAAIGGPRGRLLIAADLRKDPSELEAAYDDAAGVTAAFNKNLLRHLNAACGADFEVEAFAHRARWNPLGGRIEMHLVSRRDQEVHLGGEAIRLREGEAIVSEHCHKYTLGEFAAMAAAAGLETQGLWLDREERYSLHLFGRAGPAVA